MANEYAYLEVPASKGAGPAGGARSFSGDAAGASGCAGCAADRCEKTEWTRRAAPFFAARPARAAWGIIGELSAQETKGIQDPLAKARAIYDYVIATMRYDSLEAGGQRRAIWGVHGRSAATVRISIRCSSAWWRARNSAASTIGFPLPEDQRAGTMLDYHCWGGFYVAPYGWIPVDASEAGTSGEKNYFSGATTTIACSLALGETSG